MNYFLYNILTYMDVIWFVADVHMVIEDFRFVSHALAVHLVV